MSLFSILALVLTWLAILVGGWLGWQLLRQNGRLLLRLEGLEKRLDELEFGELVGPDGLPLDSPAPEFDLPDLEGNRHTLTEYRGQLVLLIFFNPACGFCRELAPRLAALRGVREPAEREAALDSQAVAGAASESAVTAGAVQNEGNPSSNCHPFVLVISTGDARKNLEFFSEHKISGPVLVQKTSEVAMAYQANGTPSGYLLSPEGKIASELATGEEALLALAEGKSQIGKQKAGMDQGLPMSAPTGDGDGRANRFRERSLARSRIKRDGLKAGTPAPDFRLPRVDGQGGLSLRELRGQRVLLVFSDPHCVPCNALVPQLEKFHRKYTGKDCSDSAGTSLGKAQQGLLSPDRSSSGGVGETPAGAQVVMISRGDPRENRAKVKEHGLTFPVVLQQQWEISRLYAIFATPVAYLIDETGSLASEATVGADAILSLMSSLTQFEFLPG